MFSYLLVDYLPKTANRFTNRLTVFSKIFLLVLSISTSLSGCNSDDADETGNKEWGLTFSDEFEGNALDLSKWEQLEYNRR